MLFEVNDFMLFLFGCVYCKLFMNYENEIKLCINL